MDLHVQDCLITGYESLIPTLTLPDPGDRHVLAAAIHGGANLIVTYNLSDFPAAILSQFHIEAIHPDEFVSRLFDENPDPVVEAVRLQRAGLRNPAKSAVELLISLEQCQLSQTVARIRPHASEI
jgi:hypothetical protein